MALKKEISCICSHGDAPLGSSGRTLELHRPTILTFWALEQGSASIDILDNFFFFLDSRKYLMAA